MSRPKVIGYRVNGTDWKWTTSAHGTQARSGSGVYSQDFETYREASRNVRRLIGLGIAATVERVTIPMRLEGMA